MLKNDFRVDQKKDTGLSARDRCRFIRGCGYFFLATPVVDQPRLRLFGMIYANDQALFIAIDKRKSVYIDMQKNPKVKLASISSGTHKSCILRIQLTDGILFQRGTRYDLDFT